MAYIEDDALAAYIGSEISADMGIIRAARQAAEASVNDHCGRSFDAPSGASVVRRYAPTGDIVVIHDIVDSTSLTVSDDGTTVASTDYQLEPLNALLPSGQATSYSVIRRIVGYWSCTSITRAKATVSITSTRWGWATVPPQVVEATRVLAKDLVHLRQNRFGVAGFGDFGVVRVRDNPHVTMLLAQLRHPNVYSGIA